MEVRYNQIAGQSVERLAALSDGVFAVAMTHLVLELRTPAAEAIHGGHDLWRALVMLAPQLLVYLVSFLHLGFLFTFSLMLFSTALIGQFFTYRLVFNTYVSIAFIVLVQLNYVIAPGRGPLSRH